MADDGGYAELSVLPGLYVARLESFPEGCDWRPATGEKRALVSPGSSGDVGFNLER